MYIDSSFSEALLQRISCKTKIALLVIDEENAAAPEEKSFKAGHLARISNVTACQQKILIYMQLMNCSIWSISHRMRSPRSNEPFDVTRTALKALYNGRQNSIRKPYFNAFYQTELHDALQCRGITHLVIMGWAANECVRKTVGFGCFSTGSDPCGALHLGYTVMTCDQLLHEGPSNWGNVNPQNYPTLEFYSKF
ncbi:MAG: isochorismatase family protein [Psychromonas sp.]|nr:isochorismatase family protein [Psychromonas sp.]